MIAEKIRPKNPELDITIGIPTYYGGESLVQTINGFIKHNPEDNYVIVISVDGKPLDTSVKKALKNKKVTIIENRDRTGQVGRIKQIISLCKTKYLILTQDDVIFKKRIVKEILAAFEKDPKLTMISAHVVPTKETTFFERIIHVGVNTAHYIQSRWTGGDNYLQASGRCLGFRSSMAKQFEIPNSVIDADAYLYFLNKLHKGRFQHLYNAICYIRSPKNLTEHLKQSKKYQLLYYELKKYLKIDIRKDYSIPLKLRLQGAFVSFLTNPVFFSLYL